MKNLNILFRRLVALLLCACMVLGNVSAALSDPVTEIVSLPVSLQSATPLTAAAAEARLSDYVDLQLGLYADRYLTELPSVLEDGQSLYAVLECAFKRDENNQATTLLQQAYRAGQIDDTTVFTSQINFLGLMTGNSYPTSAEDARLAQTANGNPIFRWWVDEERGLVCLTFVEEALQLDGTIDDGKLSFSGNLDLSGAGDDGNLNFTVDNETVLCQAKQGYALEKRAGKPRLDLNAKGYVVDYTVTLTLDRNMQLDASAGRNLYTAALTLVDTLSADTALTGNVTGTPAITGPDADVSISVAHNNATTNTFTIDSTDKVLPKGTYTITYQMMLKDDAAAVKLKDYEESRRTNTVELMEDGGPVSETEPVTAHAVTAWDNSVQNRFKIDKDVFTDQDPLSKYFYGAYYDENSKQYYVDYRVVVYVQEEVSTFTVTDKVSSHLSFPDESSKPIVLEGWDGADGYWNRKVADATLSAVPGVAITTAQGGSQSEKTITLTAPQGGTLQPGAYHLRVPICITRAVDNALDYNQQHNYSNTASLTSVDQLPATETDTYNAHIQKYTQPQKYGTFEVDENGNFLTVDGKYLLRWELWLGWYFYNESILVDTMSGMQLYVTDALPFDIHSYDGRNGKLHQQKLGTVSTLTNTDYITFKPDGTGFTFNAGVLSENSDGSPVGAYKIVYYTLSDASATNGALPENIKNTYNVTYTAPHGNGFNGNGPIPGEAEPAITHTAQLSVKKACKGFLNDIYTKWQITVENPYNVPFSRLNDLKIIDVVPDKHAKDVCILYDDDRPITVAMKISDSTTVTLAEGQHYTLSYSHEDFPRIQDGKYGFVVNLDMDAVSELLSANGADKFQEITVTSYLQNPDQPSNNNKNDYTLYNDGWIDYSTLGTEFLSGCNAQSEDKRSFGVKEKYAPVYGDYYDPSASKSYTVHAGGSKNGTSTTITGIYDDNANNGDGQKEVKWTILAGCYEFEKNAEPIVVTITDTFSENQSLPQYEGKDLIDLFHIASKKKPDHVIKPDSVSVSGNTFTLTFTVPAQAWCGGGRYDYFGADILVTYHTIINPDDMQNALDNAAEPKDTFTVSLSNSATLEWNGYAETVSNSGSQTFTTGVLDKLSSVDESVSEIVYTILINDIGMLLNGGAPLVLQDSLGNTNDFRYKADSFVLTDLDTGKKLTKGISVDENTYTLSWDNGFTISVPDGRRLQLTYRVDPLVEVGEDTPALINTATLNGKTVSKTQDSFRVLESDQEASVTLNDGSAGVTIRKVDATESTDNFLPNAEFAIYTVNQDGTLGRQVKTIATGENGKILLQLEHTAGYGYDTVFCMKETKAPAGYQANTDAEWYFYISTDTLEFGTTDVRNLVAQLRADSKTVVQLFNKSSSAVVDVQNDPFVCDLTIQKQSFGGSALSGAAFTLTDGDGNLVESFVVPEGGYTLTGLKSGEYTLFENSAPVGYTLGDVTQWSFTLDAEAKTIVWADGTTDAALAYVELSAGTGGPVLTVRNDGATAQLSIPVTKVLDGTDTTDQAFSFRLTAVTPGSPMPEEATITTGGASYTDAMAEVCFGSIEYAYEDIGTHIYRITEIAVDASSGFLTDPAVYQVGVDVEWENGGIVANIRSITVNGQSADTVTFTNEYVPYVSISGTKTWVDHDDYAQLRPDELTITLMADGSPALDEDGNAITQVISGEGNVWSYTFADLPKYDGDHEIVYTVSEATPAGYTSSQGADAYSLVNTHTPVTGITVNKIWDDAADQDGKRSGVVANIILTKTVGSESADIATAAVGADDAWSKTWSDLPVFEGDEKITYSVREELLTPNGYTSDTTTATVVVNNGSVDVTNSYTPEVTSATVKKVWDDEKDQDGKRPETLSVTLSDGTEVELNESNGWTATVEDLPKYADGELITYSWTEGEVPAGYTLTGNSTVGTVTTLTNSYEPKTTSIEVKKVWSDSNNQDGKRAGVVATVTLYKTVNETTTEVETVTVGAEDNWSNTWTELPVYEGGKLITYSVVETLENANGYTSDTTVAVEVANGGSQTITNSYTPEVTSATVKKVWDDEKDQDGKRSGVVASITLYKTVNETTTEVETVTVGTEDNWSNTWTNLPVYEGGKLITYSVVETLETANGYTSDTTEAATVANGGSKTITNSYTPDATSITVIKKWDDAADQDGKRSGVVATVTLYKTVNETTTEVETVTVGAEDNWSNTWTDLPVYEAGSLITYSVVETLENANGYTSDTNVAVEVANGGSQTITNSYTPDATSITVIKNWDDAADQDGKRAGVVAAVTLYKTVNETTTEVETVTVGAEDNWSNTWTDLPVYEAGSLITYSVVETLETANGYTSDTTVAVEVTNGGSQTITNSYTPDATSITVIKNWDDANDQDGKRTGVVASITLYKTVNGTTTEVETVTVGTEDNWSKKWDNLPVYEGGKLITYSVVETLETANGYTSDTTEAATVANGSSQTITNSYTPDATSITVIKNWDDAADQDGKRADVAATVTLYKTVNETTTEVETVTVGTEDNWSNTWTDLPVYEGGKLITYSVVETLENANGYTSDTTEAATVTNGGSQTITNSYTPDATSITVIKNWDDDADQDGKRSGVVATVTLYKTVNETTTEVETVTVGAENNWSKKWDNLPVYEGGKLITYSVVETLENANGYTSDTTEAATVANGGSQTITNSYTPEVTDITVIKNWDDAADQDGKRSGVVASITLYKTVDETTSEVETVTVGTEDNWSNTWTELPVYEGGKLITYSVVETLETANGYTSDTTEAATVANGGSKTITNSYTPDATSITVIKNWDDAADQDGKRAGVVASITLYKTVNESTTEVETVTVGTEDNWSNTWTDLPVCEGGKLITYSVVETLETANGYTSDTTEAATVANGGSQTITNSYTPDATSITVIKNWDDAADQDGKRADVVATVTLYKTVNESTTEVETVTVGAEDNWSNTWTDLPVYEGGKLITYSVVETLETANGYTSDTTEAATVANGGSKTITNSYTPEVTSATVKKVWDDAKDQDGKRADVVATVTLYKTVNETTTEVETVTVGAEDNWSNTWTDLPVYEGGKLITYSVVETLETGNGYTSDTTEAATVANGGSKTITNSYTPDATSITVIKNWDDAADQDGKRTDVVAAVTLYKTVNETTSEVETVTVGTEDNWSNTWTELPVYEAGSLITYSVVETLENANGYTSDTTVAVKVANGGSKTITNSYTPDATSITVIKNWDDAADQDGKRTGVVASITLYKTVNETTTEVETVTVGTKDNWSNTWTNLPVYEGGKLITYSVVETLENANGYTSDTTVAVEVANGGSKTITNSYTPDETSITVIKNWDDAADQDGKRADVVATVTLYKTVNETTTEVETVTVGTEDNWSNTWTDLPVYEAGSLITYSVVETLENANGYTSDTTVAATVANGSSKTITNSYTPEVTDITVTKMWDDANDQDGKRSGVVASITLYKTVNETTSEVETVTVGAEDNWSNTWTDLPVYEGGKLITYSVVETLETANGYTSDTIEAATVTNGSSKTITNSYTPEVTSATVKKVWDDAKDQDGKRADVVATVTLYKTVDETTTEVETVTVGAEDNWSNTWTDLPVYEGGKLITYSVVETLENANGYTSDTTEAATVTNGGSQTITNSYTPEVTDITVTKTWDDANDQDGKRSGVVASITLYKTVNETTTEVETVTVGAEDNWSNTWTDLPVYEAGSLITYSVVETLETANGYTSDTTEAATVTNGGSKTITNSYTPEVTDITVTKTWDDANNQDGLRPASIVIDLLADGTVIDTVTVTADTEGNWKWSFADLPRYRDQGTEIVYSITETLDETAAAAYTATVSGYDVVNVHTPATVEVSGSKIWIDMNDEYHTRPESITIRLLADGAEIAHQVVSVEDNWSWSFTGLPKYAVGEVGREVVYTVTEDAVDGYVTSQNGNSFTNTVQVVAFQKLDEQTGKPLSGATFALYEGRLTAPAGTALATWTSTGTPQVLAGLTTGQTYTIFETRTPYGYITMSPFVFTVQQTDTPSSLRTLTASNRHSYRFRKLSSSTSELVFGAEMAITQGETIIARWFTSYENNGWHYVADQRFKAGETYTLVELSAPYGYRMAAPVTFSIDPNDGFLIVNGVDTNEMSVVMYDQPMPEATPTPEPTTTTFQITKRWEDEDNVLGLRPDSIVVNLFRKTGSEADYPAAPYLTVTINSNGTDVWTFTFDDLPRRDNNGSLYTYMAQEEPVEGYVASYLNNGRTIVNSIPVEDLPPTPTPTLPYVTPTPSPMPRVPAGVQFIDGEWVYVDEYGIPLGGVPQTGDDTSFALWGCAVVLPMLIAALAAVEIRRRKRLMAMANTEEK